MNRETVGKISSDLLKKEEGPVSAVELERGMQEEYMKNLVECVNDAEKIYDTDFYVVIVTKREPLMPNVFRNYFFARQSCPTPDYDQTVFQFTKLTGDLAYIWTIPSRDSCYHLSDNALQVDKDERQLLDFVLQFADGSLYRLAKKLNGEELESSALITI